MKTIQFVFCIHNHQPIGNFDSVFEEAYQKSYLPFIEVVESHPTISMVLHFTGCLIEWLEDHHPDFLDRLAVLVQRRNIELLSGGFYEPVLAVIPDHDKLGQVRKMNSYLHNRFAYEPKGLWLTERVWEPHLVKPIKDAGIDYVTVDDFHFLASGKRLDELKGYFNTEEQGRTIGVFPISQKLRYAMPFSQPEETIEILRQSATEEGDGIIVMADDGEKFGVWPGTHNRCFGRENWLDRFFQLLEKNKEWLVTTTFSDYYYNYPPRGRVYLPTISYFEMNEWTLPAEKGEAYSDLIHRFEEEQKADEVRPFIRGGTWRNFLAIYDESNWMHKRMMEVSYRLADSSSSCQKKHELFATAQDELWRSQCNCAYWHGIFGGIYLPHLRHAVYHHLLSAEVILDEILPSGASERDIDGDGFVEYELQSEKLKVIASEQGGMIREFDYLPKRFNLLDSMRRYRESYHSRVKNACHDKHADQSIHSVQVAKQPGLEKYLQVDRWPRKSLMDHFFPRGVRADELRKSMPEQGDFLDGIFECRSNGYLEFIRTGKAFERKVTLKKKVILNGARLLVQIAITNIDTDTVSGLYGCELNFSMLGGHTLDRYYRINGKAANPGFLDSTATESGVRLLSIVSEWDGFRITISFDEETNLWRFPVETVSMSEAGFEKVYQSSVIMPYWSMQLSPGETLSARFFMQIDELTK